MVFMLSIVLPASTLKFFNIQDGLHQASIHGSAFPDDAYVVNSFVDHCGHKGKSGVAAYIAEC